MSYKVLVHPPDGPGPCFFCFGKNPQNNKSELTGSRSVVSEFFELELKNNCKETFQLFIQIILNGNVNYNFALGLEPQSPLDELEDLDFQNVFFCDSCSFKLFQLQELHELYTRAKTNLGNFVDHLKSSFVFANTNYHYHDQMDQDTLFRARLNLQSKLLDVQQTAHSDMKPDIEQIQSEYPTHNLIVEELEESQSAQYTKFKLKPLTIKLERVEVNTETTQPQLSSSRLRQRKPSLVSVVESDFSDEEENESLGSPNSQNVIDEEFMDPVDDFDVTYTTLAEIENPDIGPEPLFKLEAGAFVEEVQRQTGSSISDSFRLRLEQRLKRKSTKEVLPNSAKPNSEVFSRLRPRKKFLRPDDSSISSDGDSDWTPDPDILNEEEDIEDLEFVDLEEEFSNYPKKKKRIRKNCSLLSGKYRKKKSGKLYFAGIEFLESENEWTCTVCGKIFPRVISHKKLFVHLNGHAGKRPYKCKECDRAYSQVGSLRHHMKRRHNKSIQIYKCSICDKPIKSEENWRIHQNWSHMSREEYEIALRSGRNPPKLAENSFHWVTKGVRTGIKSFQCPTCGLAYSSLYSLQLHEKSVHDDTNEKFNCCGREYKTKSKYVRHIYVVHKTSANHQCSQCSKCFPNRSKLNFHLRSAHDELGGRRFKCKLCPYKSECRTKLQDHQTKHTGERKHICDICGKGLKVKWSLKTHKQVMHNVFSDSNTETTTVPE